MRETDGNCCAWCSPLAGRYVYGNEPDDIFSRHDNCTCTVTFENGREHQDVWSKKKWQTSETLKVPCEPLVLDKNQAENLQNIQLAKYRNSGNNLTNIAKGVKINSSNPLTYIKNKVADIKNKLKNTFTPEKHKEISQEYLDNLPKLSEPESISQALKATNPNKYTENCQRCVPAYEMRRRGYNVIALDAPEGDIMGLYEFRNIFSNAEWIECNGGGKNEIIEFLNSCEDNARLEVSIVTDEGAHVFCAEKINNKVIFTDPQTGEINVDRYFKKTFMENTKFCRIDNLKFNNLIKDCIEEGV